MPSSNNFLKVAAVYAITILSVIFISGKITSKTIYDKFIVNFDGIYVNTNNKNDFIKFYTEVLNFKPLFNNNSEEIYGFEISDNNKILINSKKKPNSNFHKINITIKVRNGFSKLHNELKSRISKYKFVNKNNNSEKLISQITKVDWGEKFTISDPEGNRYNFIKSKRRRKVEY